MKFFDLLDHLHGTSPDVGGAVARVLADPEISHPDALGLDVDDVTWHAISAGEMLPAACVPQDVDFLRGVFGRILSHQRLHSSNGTYANAYVGSEWVSSRQIDVLWSQIGHQLRTVRVRWRVLFVDDMPSGEQLDQLSAWASDGNAQGAQVLVIVDGDSTGKRSRTWPQGMRAAELPDGVEKIVEVDGIGVSAVRGNLLICTVNPYARNGTLTTTQDDLRVRMWEQIVSPLREMVTVAAFPLYEGRLGEWTQAARTLNAASAFSDLPAADPSQTVAAAEKQIAALQAQIAAQQTIIDRMGAVKVVEDPLGFVEKFKAQLASCDHVRDAHLAADKFRSVRAGSARTSALPKIVVELHPYVAEVNGQRRLLEDLKVTFEFDRVGQVQTVSVRARNSQARLPLFHKVCDARNITLDQQMALIDAVDGNLTAFESVVAVAVAELSEAARLSAFCTEIIAGWQIPERACNPAGMLLI